MAYWKRVLAAVGARRVVGALGGLYVLLAAGRVLLQADQGAPVGNLLITSLLIVAPGAILVYGGYWLSRADIDPEFFPDIAGWCLAGFGAMASLLVLFHLQPEGGVSTPLTAVPILTALGSVAGFVAGIHDGQAKTRTLELERRNQELRRAQVELEETIERLEEVNLRLEKSNERLEQFAYAASHDLQEPLRMVSSYLQLVDSRYRDELDEEGEEFIEFAVDGADRMQDMIAALLEYSRIETKGNPLEPVDLDAVLDDVLADLQVRVEETDADIETESLPRVEGDANQLHQLFQNLLDNALTYAGDDPPRIDVTAERDAQEWVLSVCDEGVGIDPGETDAVFQVFQRLHSRDEYAGTGIGLALCQRIVERHGGEIWVESDPGEGSTFSLTLPAAGDYDE